MGLAAPFILVQNNLKRLLAYSSLEHVYLGHAPQSMSDRHYAQVPAQMQQQLMSQHKAAREEE